MLRSHNVRSIRVALHSVNMGYVVPFLKITGCKINNATTDKHRVSSVRHYRRTLFSHTRCDIPGYIQVSSTVKTPFCYGGFTIHN